MTEVLGRYGEQVDNTTHGELARRAAAGDQVALAALCSDALPVAQQAAQYGVSPDMAQDVTGEAMVHVIAGLRAGKFTSGNFGGWVYRVTSNAKMDEFRRKGRRPVLGVDGSVVSAVAEQNMASPSAEAVTMAALDHATRIRAVLREARVPAACREPFLLHHVDGQSSYKEIAATLGISVTTVRARIHRAKVTLQNHYGDADTLRQFLAGEAIDAMENTP